MPRIVLRTAASWAASFGAVSELLGDGADGGVALPAPASASLTLFSLAHALEGDGPEPAFAGEAAYAAATAFHGTPDALRRVLDAGELPRLRVAPVGGSQLDDELRERAQERGVRVVSYYGAAELSFVAFDEGRGLRAFPHVELEVRGGELWSRSPYRALGYLGDGGPLRVEGDWATVGDLAALEDGRLRLRGRSDGAILTASATVIPEEVESQLRRLDGVRDAVVVGVPAGGVGELVAAFIEPAAGHPQLSLAALRDFAAAQLAPAHRPRLWFRGTVPRTGAGKPARAEVERLVRSGEAARYVG
jgi:acyl-CoA synthetase (AMP-forming)/AMP-acid ligase II